jgi:carboxyl-terminal processing protease
MTMIARWIVAPLIVAGAITAAPASADGDLAPSDRHRASAQIIVELLSNHHYRERDLDNELSRAAFDAYLDALDPERFYFRAADIRDFQRYRDKLDDQLRQGKLDAAWEIFRVYRKRVQQRSDYARQLLESGLDLENSGTYRLDRKTANWVNSETAMDELWRERIQNDVLSLKLADNDGGDPPAERLTERYAQLARNVGQYTADDVFEIYMNAWSRLFDPHTNYLSPRTRENFNINMSLSLQGIGAMLTIEGQYTKVTELVAGGPADKDGELSAGDRIVAVGQGDEEMESVVGWRLGDVVQRIRGPKGSVVRLETLSEDSGSRKIIDITRNEIVLDDRAAKGRLLMLDHGAGQQRIGVIELPSFYHDFSPDDDQKGRSTTADVAKLIKELAAEQPLDGLVIDLRGNTGGSLQEAAKMTGLFVKDGPVVQVEYSSGQRNVLRDDDDGLLAYNGPLTVLVNGRSASASEIFAGAMQDYGRGLVLGAQTFGKGTVQDLVDLNRYQFAADGKAGSVKFTRAKYYRITGASTQKRGIKPDIDMTELLRDTGDISERHEDNALPWDQIEALDFERVGDPNRYVETLAERYHERVRERATLTALRAQRELEQRLRQRERVPLAESERRAERNERDEKRLEALNQRLRAMGREPVESPSAIEADELPDLVAREAARITADLSDLEGGSSLAPVGGYETVKSN